jgi:16S rRNA C967 or C1407 C5-methylase (RsmB/RsmF family)
VSGLPSPAVEGLDRYAALLAPEDAAAFLAAAVRPLPTVVWANPLRGDPERTAAEIRARCPDAVPLTWRAHAWRLPPDAQPGRWPGYLLGGFHVQEEAALWAALLLGAEPGERVLDLCAAPGNKTAQLALAMADRGCLWAVDRSAGRLISLRRTLERLGVTCASVICDDAASMALPEGTFDRVLADVPCTGEGTTRKGAGKGRRAEVTAGERRQAAVLQGRILRRGLAALRPGGILVYATCTYAPEENEAVLDGLPPGLADIETVSPPPGLRTRPGLGTFEGRTYCPTVGRAHRLWPQDNDTGGFFVARLRRL